MNEIIQKWKIEKQQAVITVAICSKMSGMMWRLGEKNSKEANEMMKVVIRMDFLDS